MQRFHVGRVQNVWLVILITLWVMYCFLSMRGFDFGLLYLSVDNPIYYARVFQKPILQEGTFIFDVPTSQMARLKEITSALNWFPLLLWRVTGLSTYVTTWIMALLQGILLGLALVKLTFGIKQPFWVVATSVLFTYMSTPWNWNGANYEASAPWNFWPYASTLSIGPSLMALVAVIKGKRWLALGLMVAAGLIHPALTLPISGIIGLYWLIEMINQQSWREWSWLLALMGLSLIYMAPTLYISLFQTGTTLSQNEILTGMKFNQHLSTWIRGNSFTLPLVCKWFALILLSWRHREDFPPVFRRLWWASWVVALLFSLSQLAGGILGIPQVLSVIGLRDLAWPAILAVPIVINYLLKLIREGKWYGSVWAILCICMPAFVSMDGLFWPAVVGLTLYDIGQGGIIFWRVKLNLWLKRLLSFASVLLLFTWICGLLIWHKFPADMQKRLIGFVWTNRGYPVPDPSRLGGVILASLAVVLLISLIQKQKDEHRRSLLLGWANLGLILGCAGIFLQAYSIMRQDVAQNPVYLLSQAINHSTPEQAKILSPVSGIEAFTERRLMRHDVRLDYSYAVSQETFEYRQKVLKPYGLTIDELRQWGWAEAYRQLDSIWSGFKEQDFSYFAKTFGVTHLVVANEGNHSKLDFPRVYEDKNWVIYQLGENP